mgnify:CR=1 FL=1
MQDQTIRFKDEGAYIYLRYNWSSTSPKLDVISTELAERCRQSRSTKRQVHKDFTPAFKVILTSLEIQGAYVLDQWIRIVTDQDIYGGKTQRSAAHNRQVLTAMVWLINHGYLLKVDIRRKVKSKDTSQFFDLPFAYIITDKWRREIASEPI